MWSKMWKNCGFVEIKRKVRNHKMHKNAKHINIYKKCKVVHKGYKHVDKLIYIQVYKRG